MGKVELARLVGRADEQVGAGVAFHQQADIFRSHPGLLDHGNGIAKPGEDRARPVGHFRIVHHSADADAEMYIGAAAHGARDAVGDFADTGLD